MPEKSLAEIPRQWRELYEKGSAALQRQNLDYALALFNQVLQNEPGFYDCREALRATQFKKAGAGSSFLKKMFGSASSSPLLAKAQIFLRSNPLEAIQIAEQILNSDPASVSAHRVLAEAALEAGLLRTAVLSLEIALKNSPKDREIAMRLGEALTLAGQVSRAETVYTELQKAYPTDNAIAQALKNLSANRTMSEGGYETIAGGQGSYRDMLKDKQEAVSIEQENRQVKSDDVADRLMLEYEGRLAKEPDNLNLLRMMAQLCTQKNDFARALGFYSQITATEGGNDPSLERAITDTHLRKFDFAISQLDPASPNYAEARGALESERQSFQIEDARRRADKYPNDLQIRFELGELYIKQGKISEAIQEFQKAQVNPNRRIAALSYLGQCFAHRGMWDLAARTLQNAIREKQGFDDEKKELIYSYGQVLEKMGKVEEAMEQFKQIYEMDIGYKDVAAKVDAYYAAK